MLQISKLNFLSFRHQTTERYSGQEKDVVDFDFDMSLLGQSNVTGEGLDPNMTSAIKCDRTHVPDLFCLYTWTARGRKDLEICDCLVTYFHAPHVCKLRIQNLNSLDFQQIDGQRAIGTLHYDKSIMKDITDTVNDVCMVTVATLPNGLQLHLHCVLYGRLLFVQDITITSALLHVPYKSELIITQMSKQTSINFYSNETSAIRRQSLLEVH